MAHNIEIIDGRASMFSVAFSPWHTNETNPWLLTVPPTLDDALTYMRARYRVDKQEVSYTTGPDRITSAKAWLTVRADTGRELGAVGSLYTPIQNDDAVRCLEPLLDEGVLQLVSGAVLDGGGKIFLLGKFDLTRFGPVCREVFTDEVVPYALVRNDHTGTGKARVQTTSIRVVCENTLDMADAEFANGAQRGAEVAHTAGGTVKLIEAAEDLFRGIVERYERVAADYRALKACVFTPADFKHCILDVAAPSPFDNPNFNPDGRQAGAVIERWERKASTIVEAWDTGKGHTGDHSAWEAYNALVEVVDHNAELFPLRSGVWRKAALMDGRLRDMKDMAYARVRSTAGLCASTADGEAAGSVA